MLRTIRIPVLAFTLFLAATLSSPLSADSGSEPVTCNDKICVDHNWPLPNECEPAANIPGGMSGHIDCTETFMSCYWDTCTPTP